MFLASIYRRDYLAPLTSAGYRRRTGDLHVCRVTPWMEPTISSLNLPTWPAGPVKWTVGRRRRACSTRGNASYRLRLASFMHIHGRTCSGRTRAHGRTGARTATQFRLVARSFIYVRTVNAHGRGGGPEARIPSFLALGSVTTSLTPVEPFSHRHHRISVHPRPLCRSMPSGSGLRSYLATRLRRSGSPPGWSPTAARPLSCVFVEITGSLAENACDSTRDTFRVTPEGWRDNYTSRSPGENLSSHSLAKGIVENPAVADSRRRVRANDGRSCFSWLIIKRLVAN